MVPDNKFSQAIQFVQSELELQAERAKSAAMAQRAELAMRSFAQEPAHVVWQPTQRTASRQAVTLYVSDRPLLAGSD